MEEEDDDFYGTSTGPAEGEQASAGNKAQAQQPAPKVEEDEEEEEEEEEDDEEEDSESGSDIDIITERKDMPEQQLQTTRFQQPKSEPVRMASAEVVPKSQTPVPSKQTPAAAAAAVTLKNGANYPEVHTSTVNVNEDPVWGPAGKPISQVDIDVDLVEHAKPWRLPGADQSDYFNYGFDEFTWASYVLRQQNMASTLESQKAETAQFQTMFGGGGGGGGGFPGMPGMPGGGGGGGGGAQAQQQQQQQQQQQNAAAAMGMGMGMGPEDMQQAMFAEMAAQGVSDPSQLNFNTFMQRYGGQMANAPQMGQGQGAGPQGPGGQQQQGGYGGYGNPQQQGGFGGRGRGRRW